MIHPAEVARRVRAAIGYSGLEYAPLSRMTGLGEGVLRRMAAKTDDSQRGAKSIEELWAIADACGVPRTFMEYGFEPAADAAEEVLRAREEEPTADLIMRLGALEEQVRELVARDSRRAAEERQQTGASLEPTNPPRPRRPREARGERPLSDA